MNRQIKFRVWDDKNKKYIKNPVRFHQRKKGLFYMFGSEHIQERYLVHEQFTGLKDKFNRDIYEGYLIVFKYNQEGREPSSPTTREQSEVYEVYWDERLAGFKMRTGKIYQNSSWANGYLPNPEDEIELVGTKFENPELLEFKRIRPILLDIWQKN